MSGNHYFRCPRGCQPIVWFEVCVARKKRKQFGCVTCRVPAQKRRELKARLKEEQQAMQPQELRSAKPGLYYRLLGYSYIEPIVVLKRTSRSTHVRVTNRANGKTENRIINHKVGAEVFPSIQAAAAYRTKQLEAKIKAAEAELQKMKDAVAALAVYV